jgi:hypothetical protein
VGGVHSVNAAANISLPAPTALSHVASWEYGCMPHKCPWTCTAVIKFSVERYRYEGVSKSFRTESITKYTLTKINTRWEATQRVMAAKLTRLAHKLAIQLHLVAESCSICSSRSWQPVRKLLDTPSCVLNAFFAVLRAPLPLKFFCRLCKFCRGNIKIYFFFTL